MVIPMVIQTILRDPSGPDQTDAAPNVSRQDPTRTVREPFCNALRALGAPGALRFW